MFADKVRRVILGYSMFGFTALFIGMVLESVFDFNPEFKDGITLEKSFIFIGILTLILTAFFAVLIGISNKAPNQMKIVNYQDWEVPLQKVLIVCNGIAILFLALAATLFYETNWFYWVIAPALMAVFVGWLIYVRLMRINIFSKFEPSLCDERDELIQTKSYADGFRWLYNGFGVVLLGNYIFELEMPIWFLYFGPILIGYFGVHWSALKSMRNEEIQI